MNKFKKIFIIFISLIFIMVLLLLVALFLIFSNMKNNSISNLYYDRGISIIPTADYIVVPGAQIEINSPRSYVKTSFRLCLFSIPS